MRGRQPQVLQTFRTCLGWLLAAGVRTWKAWAMVWLSHFFMMPCATSVECWCCFTDEVQACVARGIVSEQEVLRARFES